MQKKIRINHGLNVPRDLVYVMMKDLDAEGVEARGGLEPQQPRRRKEQDISQLKALTGFTPLMDTTS
jgi:hypothetical protein